MQTAVKETSSEMHSPRFPNLLKSMHSTKHVNSGPSLPTQRQTQVFIPHFYESQSSDDVEEISSSLSPLSLSELAAALFTALGNAYLTRFVIGLCPRQVCPMPHEVPVVLARLPVALTQAVQGFCLG